MPTEKEKEARQQLNDRWLAFNLERRAILARRESGFRLSEADVEAIFEKLAQGPLGYEGGQIARQQDYADRVLMDRCLKLVVVEIKNYGAFQHPASLEEALVQAARYADCHRAPFLMAFDGQRLVLARRHRPRNEIQVILDLGIDSPSPPEDLFYCCHYGLFHLPQAVRWSLSYNAAEDEQLYKRHHGERLHYSCFAYVGDLRDKQTWLMPYRNADGSVDTKRLGHAVNYLLSPGGYRGQKAETVRVPEAATLLCALRLAGAYKELGQWQEASEVFYRAGKPTPQELLWMFLHQHGAEDL